MLAENFAVHAVDLPGHGKSRSAGGLEEAVEKLSIQFSEPVAVCGWSLGGQIAMQFAMRYPQKVHKLILVAATPCFVQKENWPCAMEEKTLAGFASILLQDYESTLRRFLALQARGVEKEKELLLQLRKRLASRKAPEFSALQSGLKMLRDTDLRDKLSQVGQETLAVAGERDALTPPEAVRRMTEAMPNARMAEVKGASHAPFLSHPDEFTSLVTEFLHG
jgi:pimeloyl-[acyl-carrier protein] methyl ester esterase